MGHLREDMKRRLPGWETRNDNIREVTKKLEGEGRQWGFTERDIRRTVQAMLGRIIRPTFLSNHSSADGPSSAATPSPPGTSASAIGPSTLTLGTPSAPGSTLSEGEAFVASQSGPSTGIHVRFPVLFTTSNFNCNFFHHQDLVTIQHQSPSHPPLPMPPPSYLETPTASTSSMVGQY